MSNNILYELKNINQYYDDKQFLNIPFLSIEKGQIIGVIGPNGSGKSTLFSLLAFINTKFDGDLIFNANSSKDLILRQKQDVVFLPQNPYLLKKTVYENIAYGLKIRNKTQNLEQKVYDALSLVGLDKSFAKRKHNQLSGGETQRVALAARLVLKPKVLILDEPTSGVDINSAQLIKRAILKAKRDFNTSIILSSHDFNWLNHICDKKIALFKGELTASSSVNLLFAPWEKDENLNLVKYFDENQKLVIKNTQGKKRDSIAMINAEDIYISKNNNYEFKAVVNSIYHTNSENKLIVEFCIGDINFSCHITKDYMQEENILPSDTINVYIDTKNIYWI